MKRLLVTVMSVLFFSVRLALAGPYEDGYDAYSRGDYVTSLQLLQPTAYQGNAHAQRFLGWIYETGQGIKQDYSAAIFWYQMAAAQGDGYAQLRLGTMYADGRGVAINLNVAAQLLKLAANKEEQGAADTLEKVLRQLSLAQAAEARASEVMSVLDFMLDMKQLSGREVRVQGAAICYSADDCYLDTSPGVGQLVSFDPSALPREERRKLLQCARVGDCAHVTVRGRALGGANREKLIAYQVYW